MNLYSHATVANRLCKQHFPKHKKLFVVIGSLMPDLNPTTQPHRNENLLYRIQKNHDAIKNAKSDFKRSYLLGILLHYICDYFCYAHNYNLDISHGKNHIKYEIELHKLIREDFNPNLDLVEIKQDLMQYIIETKELYDAQPSHILRDLQYSLEVVESILTHLIPVFNFKTA